VKFSKELGKTEDDLPKKSLGKGQEKSADASIVSARSTGKWIILQNCHMCPSFMPILESKVVDTTANFKNQCKARKDDDPEDEIEEDKKVNPNFRFWITTMPDEKFPT